MPTIITRGAISAQAFGFGAKPSAAADSYWWARLYSTSGNLAPSKRFGIDSSNNIYIQYYTSYPGCAKFNNSGVIQFQNEEYGTPLSGGNSFTTSNGTSFYFDNQAATSFSRLINRSSSGAVAWTLRLSRTSYNIWPTYGLVANSTGDSYLTLRWASGSTTALNQLVKISSTGTLVWAQSLSFTMTAGQTIYLTLDASENVFLTGSTGFLMKYNSSGVLQWHKTYSTSLQVAATDASGNIYAIQAGTGVVKFDSTGAIVWQKTIANGSNSVNLVDICVDAGANVYVSGSDNVTSNGIVAKLDSSGAAQWLNTITFSSAAFTSAYSISINSLGSVVVYGFYDLSSVYNLFVLKVPPNGAKTGTYGALTYASGTLSLTTTSNTVATGSATSSGGSITLAPQSVSTGNTSYTTTTTTI